MRSPAWGEVALGSCDLERIDAVTALVVSENSEKQPHNSDYMYTFLCAAQCTHVSYVYTVQSILAFDLSDYLYVVFCLHSILFPTFRDVLDSSTVISKPSTCFDLSLGLTSDSWQLLTISS